MLGYHTYELDVRGGVVVGGVFMNGYLGIHTDGLKCLNLWQMVAKIIEEYFSKSYLMLYEWVKVKKYLPLGSQKIKNGYLGICSDGFHFLSLWQMMPKIIEFFFYVYS